MRRYLITVDIQDIHALAEIDSLVKDIDRNCEHPHRGAWVASTDMSAAALRQHLLPHVDFNCRLFICEAGSDAAKFNALERVANRNVIRFEERKRSPILESVLSRRERSSIMLKAATAGN